MQAPLEHVSGLGGSYNGRRKLFTTGLGAGGEPERRVGEGSSYLWWTLKGGIPGPRGHVSGLGGSHSRRQK
jgi:hypothetical protein